MADQGEGHRRGSVADQGQPRLTGTYLIALWLNSPQRIAVGRLGEVCFPAGWYLYAGSALGPGGLRARLARHLRRLADGKRAHWHVDYLREKAAWAGGWGCASDQRLECAWVMALLHLPGAQVAALGFGASDCRCPTHLVRVPLLPGDDWLACRLGTERIRMGDEELRDLLAILTTGSDESREAAALAVGRFGADALGPLRALLSRDDPDARWWAARTLAQVGGDGAVDLLVSTLTDPDPDVRACAALALGRIGSGRAAPALADRLADESTFVAGVAADALSMVGEPAIEALAGKLKDERPHARLLAVRALGRIGSQRAIGPLCEALEDPSYLVRHCTADALEALGVGMVFFAP